MLFENEYAFLAFLGIKQPQYLNLNSIPGRLPEQATYMEKHLKQLVFSTILSRTMVILLPKFENVEKVVFRISAETVHFINYIDRVLELMERWGQALKERGTLAGALPQIERLAGQKFDHKFSANGKLQVSLIIAVR
jgi:hypothetical protein